MKQLLAISFLLIVVSSLSGQDIRERFEKGTSNAITVEADYPGIEILQGNSNSIEVHATLVINGIPIPKAMELKWDKASNTLTVKTDIHFTKDMSAEEWDQYLEKLDCDSLKRSYMRHNDNHYGNWNFDGDVRVYVPASIRKTMVRSTYGSIDMDYLSPEVDVFNTYGSIHARLDDRVDEIELTSTYSKVTLEVADGARPDVRMESHYGELLSNVGLDIDTKKSVHKQFENVIYGKLNRGGGTQVKLRSDYGDVVLKKI